MVKRRGLKQFKQLKTPMMSLGTKKRRTERAGALAEKFGKSWIAENGVWQDAKRLYSRCFLELDRRMQKNTWIFIQDSVPSHCANVPISFKTS